MAQKQQGPPLVFRAPTIVEAPKYLCHYTNKAGYDGILASKTIRASTLAGIKNTHFGKGVYFAGIDPDDMSVLSTYQAVEWNFGTVTADAVDKMQYYIEVEVDPSWYVQEVFDPLLGAVKDIWLSPGDTDISIKGRIRYHGKM